MPKKLNREVADQPIYIYKDKLEDFQRLFGKIITHIINKTDIPYKIVDDFLCVFKTDDLIELIPDEINKLSEEVYNKFKDDKRFNFNVKEKVQVKEKDAMFDIPHSPRTYNLKSLITSCIYLATQTLLENKKKNKNEKTECIRLVYSVIRSYNHKGKLEYYYQGILTANITEKMGYKLFDPRTTKRNNNAYFVKVAQIIKSFDKNFPIKPINVKNGMAIINVHPPAKNINVKQK